MEHTPPPKPQPGQVPDTDPTTDERLAESIDALRASEERYRTLVASIDEGFCVIEVLFDERNYPVDYRFLEANPAFERQTGLVDVVGRTARELVPGLNEFWFRTYGNVAVTGEAVRFEDYAAAMGRWFDVYALRIGVPEEHKVGILFTDISTRKEAQEALRKSEERLRDAKTRLEAALSAGEIATWTFDITGDRIVADMNLARLFSLAPEDASGGSLGAYLHAIHPEDRDRVADAVNDAVAYRDSFEAEYRVVLPDGASRWLVARGRVERDAQGRAVSLPGVVVDISSRKETQQEIQRLAAVVENSTDFIGIARMDGTGLFLNEAGRRLVGLDNGADISAYKVEDFFIPEDRTLLTGEVLPRVMREGYDAVEARFQHFTTGESIWVNYAAFTVPDPETKETVALVTITRDIRERKALEAEREKLLAEARARAEREALVNQIGEAVRTVLEPAEVLAVTVELLGRALGADRCYFVTYEMGRDWGRIETDWYRGDRGLTSLAGEFRSSNLALNQEADYQSGQTQVVDDAHEYSLSALDASAASTPLPPGFTEAADPSLSLMDTLGLRSLVRAPLLSSGRMTALTVAMADRPRRWTTDEVRLVETVAAQTRAAAEAARIQQRERTIATQLQDALQPPPPAGLPGLALASFYRPALQEAGVGGDFFDVFSIEKGCTGLIVADLSGKGLSAASEVATVRNMVRYALYTGTTVAEAITGLNQILVEHDLLSGFATVFVGSFSHEESSLTYVNCGQEPGLIWRAGTGHIEELGPTGAVLGGFDGGSYTQETVTLQPGDILALFTDGMTEIGPNRKDLMEIEGLTALFARCCEASASLPHLSAADAAARVKDALIAGVEAHAGGAAGNNDDIALLIGVARQDREGR